MAIAVSSFVNEPGVDRWGYFQFPTLDRLLDGRIAITFHINADSATAYGKTAQEPNRCVSGDGGQTWKRMMPDDPVSGMLLSNGERLWVGDARVTPPALPISDYSLPAEQGVRIGSYGQQPYVCYRHNELPDALKGVPSARMSSGATTWVKKRARLDDPELLRFSTEGVFPVTWWGDVHSTPENNLIAVVYPCRLAGDEFGPIHCGCYESIDQGHSWQLKGRLLYRPDTKRDSYAAVRDGFTEPASLILPDGELLAILRTTDGHGDGPLYQTRSTNGGVDWSPPEVMRSYGVMPRLLRLGNGVLVLSSGRPGADLSFSLDGRGETWTDPARLVSVTSEGNQDDSCGYTSLLALDDNSFLVAYSWFKKPAEEGNTRKAIMVRRVTMTP